jgi:hypothetical protein
VVEHLPTKHKALSSNSSTTKKSMLATICSAYKILVYIYIYIYTNICKVVYVWNLSCFLMKIFISSFVHSFIQSGS